MRLYPEEERALKESIQDVEGEVYLFGSRVDDSRHGGDIDILIYSREDSLTLSQQVSQKFFAQLESKLDVVVFNQETMTPEQQAFVNTLTMVRLK